MANSLNSELRKRRELLMEEVLNYDLYGKKIYLIGTAEYGPTNEPIRIKSTAGLYNRFGKEGSLIRAFHALKYTSQDNEVYLVKTTGEFSMAYLNVNLEDDDIFENAFVFVSSQSNEIFNEIKITIDTDRIWIEYPDDLNIRDHIQTFMYDDYPTISELAEAINKKTDKRNGFLYAHYDVDSSIRTHTAFYCCNPTEIYLFGGQCGLDYSKNLLYNCLQKTYSLIESYDIDIIVPVEAYIDDIYPDDAEDTEWQYNMKYYQSTKDYLTEDMFGRQRSFLNQLINFCVIQNEFGLVTTGIMGFAPTHDYESDYLSEADDIAVMWRHALEYNLSCCDLPSYSFLVSIVGGDLKYNQGVIIDNGYLAYAALCADTQIIQGTTNVPLKTSIAIYNEFSEETLKDLADSQIVAFRHSPLYNAPVVYDGLVLQGPKDRGLTNFANIRMIQICMSYMTRLFNNYIGEDMVNLIENHILKDDLEKLLFNIKSKGIISEFAFELKPDYIHGRLTVFLTLQTVYMTEAVKLCTVMEITTETDYE